MSKNRQKFSLTRAIKHSREGLHPSRPSKPVSQINNRRRQSEVQFFDLANSLPVIIWLWDVNLHCSWLNNFWSEYTGLDTTQSLTNGWLEAMHPEDQPGWLAAFALGTANCRAIRHEFRLTKSEGGYRWIALRAEPRYTKDRVFEGLTGTGTDITELYESRIEAERLAQTRTALLSTVSHEIRTPMNGILGLTTLALNQPINEEVRDQLTGIAASSKGLINILNDILDFSKIESNSLTLANTPTDLKKLVNLLFDLYQPPAFMAGLTFSTHVSPKIPPFVQVDEKRLFQTLSNLLSNAIKFTAKGSVKLEIACLNHVQTHMTLRFTVVDTGIGLDKNKLIDLVQPFVQADSSISRKYGGAGLGLSISQGILHTMGSQLQVESEPSQGSTFYFDLALTISENHDSTSRFSEMNTIDPVVSLQKIFNDKLLTGKHILLAEDNRINQQVALSFLKRAGAKIELANNGIEALALLKEMKFDAILMDVQMPELDGLDATRKIRQQKEFQLIPIIGLSAGISAHERNACLDCGMNDFLPKPINPEQLVQTIQKWTESIKTDEKSGEQYQPSDQFSSQSASKPGSNIIIDTPVSEHTSNTGPLNALVGFDMKNVISMLGDEALTHHLMKMFIEDTQHLVKDIEISLAAKNFVDAQKIVHMLIGSSGILGAIKLHAAAEQLDLELRQARLEPQTYQTFQQAIEETRAVLINFIYPASSSDIAKKAEPELNYSSYIAGKSILVADDNRFVQQAMQSLLSTAGARVVIASNGSQALALLEQQHFDAVLMDLEMPVMDGLEATRRIRAAPKHHHLPVLGLSAKATDKDKESCLENGMNQLIAKTIKPDQLIELLCQHIKIHPTIKIPIA